jgi:putative ABC transport system ATP-binding protein
MRDFITVNKVVKAYRRGKQEVRVLDEVSLSVERGAFLSLMGPSGSGKTTLLNLMGGLDSPDGGEIIVGEERVDRLNGAQLSLWRAHHVGFVFQLYNLLPVLSAEQNVEIPLLLTKLSSRERKKHVSIALELVGLSERARHKPSELSGGQQQRVALARAIVADPTLLVCDEPTGDLDRNSADEILQLLQALNQQSGKTIVMVTHDPKAAEYASKQVRIDKGRLVETAAEVSA